MITPTKSGPLPQPREFLNLMATGSGDTTEPRNITDALSKSHWLKAVEEAMQALYLNKTWRLVSREPHMNVFGFKWVFKTKLKADGTIDRHKTRLVAKGYNQIEGLDFEDTFSPVVKATTIRFILTLATVRKWPLRQLDLKNAFLHGRLKETVYMEQPPRLKDNTTPNHVCLLQRAINGLKQAPKAWFQRFSEALLHLGFHGSHADSSLFVLRKNTGIIVLLLYVDDIVVTGNNSNVLDSLISQLSNQFSLKDMGTLHFFLGIEVLPYKDGLYLSQAKYAKDILNKTMMMCARAIHTPHHRKMIFPPTQVHQ